MEPRLEINLECLVFHDKTDDEDYLQLATELGYAKAYLKINELLEDKHALDGEDVDLIIDRVESMPEWYGKVLANEMHERMMAHVSKQRPINTDTVEELDELLDAYILIGNLFGKHNDQ